MKSLRLSIEPTYDHRKTGHRFFVSSRVADYVTADRIPIQDPFVRHSVKIHWWDAIKCLLNFGRIEVTFYIDGDREIIEDVMELDGNYIGQNSTRRAEFTNGIEKALSNL